MLEYEEGLVALKLSHRVNQCSVLIQEGVHALSQLGVVMTQAGTPRHRTFGQSACGRRAETGGRREVAWDSPENHARETGTPL